MRYHVCNNGNFYSSRYIELYSVDSDGVILIKYDADLFLELMLTLEGKFYIDD